MGSVIRPSYSKRPIFYGRLSITSTDGRSQLSFHAPPADAPQWPNDWQETNEHAPPPPDACGPQHATGEAWVRMEWSSRTDTSLSIVPATKLYHRRLGWKVAVDLNPAATASGASTVEWPRESGGEGARNDGIREITAGELVEIVVQARDVNGNHRGIGEWCIWTARGRYMGGCTTTTAVSY